MRGLLSGRIRGIEIDGLHADLRLGLEKPDAAGEKPAFDPEAFAASLRKARGHLIPLSLDMRNVSLRATRDDAMVFMLAPSRLRHGPGEPVFELDLAEVTTGDGRVWPAQQTRITWNTDSLALDRLDPWPGVGLRGLAISLPEDGAFAADAQLRMNDAVFVISASSGNGSLTADLREGRLDSRWIAENFAIEIPASAELSSFSLNVENLLPAPSRATGAARLLLENLSAAGWDASELSLDLALQADRMTLAASGQSSGTAFALDAEARMAGTSNPANCAAPSAWMIWRDWLPPCRNAIRISACGCPRRSRWRMARLTCHSTGGNPCGPGPSSRSSPR